MDWSLYAAPGLRALAPYRPGITHEQLKRDTGLDVIRKFSSNESPIGPSPAVFAAMQQALADSHRYPDVQALTERLARHLQVPADRLVLGNGSIDVIASLVRAFVGPGQNVVLSERGYCAYPAFVTEQGATIRLAPSRADFGHDADALLRRIDERTRLLLIDSPGNLSGVALDAAALQRLLRGVPKQVLVVLDEAYIEFADGAVPRGTERWPLQHANVVVTRTFSKAYGLAGLRIGYGIADAGVVDCLNRIRPPFPVSRVALAAAGAALDDAAHVERIVQCARSGRVALAEALRGFGLDVIDGSANFVLADFGPAARSVFDALLARGFITRPMSAYGLPTHIRISVGTPAEVDQLVQALRGLLPGTAPRAEKEAA